MYADNQTFRVSWPSDDPIIGLFLELTNRLRRFVSTTFANSLLCFLADSYLRQEGGFQTYHVKLAT
jgi:hypothetical protein